jgi:hypothetical protein
MKKIEEKLRRKVKYWHISYQQANGRERLHVGLFTLMMLVYIWCTILVF